MKKTKVSNEYILNKLMDFVENRGMVVSILHLQERTTLKVYINETIDEVTDKEFVVDSKEEFMAKLLAQPFHIYFRSKSTNFQQWYNDLAGAFIQEVFKSGDLEQKKLFIQTINEVFTYVRVPMVAHACKAMQYEDVMLLFSYGPRSWLQVSHYDIRSTLAVFKDMPQGAKIAKSFLQLKKSHGQIRGDRAWTSVRDAILQDFPNDIELFQEFAVIQEVLKSKAQDIFINCNGREFNLKIDLNLVRTSYYIPGFILESYKNLLNIFTVSLHNKGQAWQLQELTIEHVIYGKTYSHTNVYALVQPESLLDQQGLKQLICEFLSYCQHGKIKRVPDIYDSIDPWLDQALLDIKLEKRQQGSRKISKV